MQRILSLCLIANFFLTGVAKSADELPAKPAEDLKAMQGLWRGLWGGGSGDDGVVFQPAIAELFVRGNQAVWSGFPIQDGTGPIRLQSNGKQREGRFTYTAKPKGESETKAVDFKYELEDGILKLKFGDNGEQIQLDRITVQQTPFANLHVSFETARGVDKQGNLLVTMFNAIKIGESGPEVTSQSTYVRSLKGVKIYRIEASGAKPLTVEDTRQLLRTPRSVVVTHRRDRNRKPAVDWPLSRRVGQLNPDSEAGFKTLTGLLKSGTLIFVLPGADLSLAP